MTEALAQNEEVALATIEVDVQGTHIESYGGRTEVRELGDRLMALHPAAAEVGQAGMRAVAQLAILSGASPLPGTNEIHVWKNSKGVIQTTLGINYFRRRARELGGIFWRSRPQQMNVKEREEYLIPDGVIAAICEAVRIEDMLRFRELGFAAQDIFDSVGEIGVATVLPGARTKQNRPLLWTAFKGAEIDLYRKLFPMLSDSRPPVAADDNGAPQPAERRERSAAEMREISNGLYDDPDAPGLGDEWDQNIADASEEGAPEPVADAVPGADESTGEINMAKFFRGEMEVSVNGLVASYHRSTIHKDRATATATPKQAGLVASLFTEAFAPDENAAKEYHSALAFLFEREDRPPVDSAKKLTFCEAQAILRWLTSGKDKDTGEYRLNEGVEAKARLCLRQAMLDAEQTEMDMMGEEEE